MDDRAKTEPTEPVRRNIIYEASHDCGWNIVERTPYDHFTSQKAGDRVERAYYDHIRTCIHIPSDG